MGKPNEKKKTVHFNTNLGTNKLMLQFYEDANDGRSFSSFTKDILHAAALEFYNSANDNSQVLISPTVRVVESMGKEDDMEPVESPNAAVKTDIASAAATMFGIT